MSVTITFHGAAARQHVRSLAKAYAMLAIKSTLPVDTVNAPWRFAAEGKSWQAVYRKWMRQVDRERADYRKSLLTVLPDLPVPPVVEWRPYKSASGKTYSAVYSGASDADAVMAAEAYAAECMALLNL